MEFELYEGQVYRPPSEAGSLIVQVTSGCSYNRCIYCSMYKDRKFHLRPFEEVLLALRFFRSRYQSVPRIFLADGDVLALSYGKLLRILRSIRELFPECERISAYGSSRNLRSYTAAQLRELHRLGLSLIYMGVESGSDAVLEYVRKGQTRELLIESADKLTEAGILISASVICGLGGSAMASEHAEATAEVLNRIDPRYLGILRLTIDPGTVMEQLTASGEFLLQSEYGILEEMYQLISGLDLSECIVRSNHVCNLVAVSGTIGYGHEGKAALLQQLDAARQVYR